MNRIKYNSKALYYLIKYRLSLIKTRIFWVKIKNVEDNGTGFQTFSSFSWALKRFFWFFNMQFSFKTIFLFINCSKKFIFHVKPLLKINDIYLLFSIHKNNNFCCVLLLFQLLNSIKLYSTNLQFNNPSFSL